MRGSGPDPSCVSPAVNAASPSRQPVTRASGGILGWIQPARSGKCVRTEAHLPPRISRGDEGIGRETAVLLLSGVPRPPGGTLTCLLGERKLPASATSPPPRRLHGDSRGQLFGPDSDPEHDPFTRSRPPQPPSRYLPSKSATHVDGVLPSLWCIATARGSALR
jgi:hypothetical protein